MMCLLWHPFVLVLLLASFRMTDQQQQQPQKDNQEQQTGGQQQQQQQQPTTPTTPPFDAGQYLKDGDDQKPRPPILLLPGLVSSRLVAWKRKVCRGPDIQIQDVVWLNLAKMMETMTYDKTCWIDCLKLGYNGTDPPDCKIRAGEGLSAIGELSPGNLYTPPTTSIFTALIKMLASELGYDSNSMIGAAYDWRLAPIQLQQRDSFFTTLKQWLEVAVERHKRPAIVIAHSMGTNLFLYFCDW